MCEIGRLWAKVTADIMYKWLEENPKSARKGDMWCAGFFAGLEAGGIVTEKETKILSDSYPPT